MARSADGGAVYNHRLRRTTLEAKTLRLVAPECLLCALGCGGAVSGGYKWDPPTGDEPEGEETVKVIDQVAAGEVAINDLAEWIGQRLKEPG